MSIEAAELNEVFLWNKAEDVHVEKVKEELADVFAYVILLADIAYLMNMGDGIPQNS